MESGGSSTPSPTNLTGPSQDHTPEDGRRSDWPKRRVQVQSYTTDEDESPKNSFQFVVSLYDNIPAYTVLYKARTITLPLNKKFRALYNSC